MKLSQYCGDSVTHTIPLTWAGAAFTPGADWGLLFTAKRKASDLDDAALIQKTTVAGITATGSNAAVALVPQDTRDLGSCDLPWDIQAQHVTTGEVRTVADGRLSLVRDISRLTSVSIPVHTSTPPVSRGEVGPGVPEGGTTGQVLSKASNDDLDTEWVDGGAASNAWNDITGKPAEFPPSAHTHTPESIGAATAAQGALADSALQDPTAFATAAQGALADSALQDGSIYTRHILQVSGVTSPTSANTVLRYAGLNGSDRHWTPTGDPVVGSLDGYNGTVLYESSAMGHPWSYKHWNGSLVDYIAFRDWSDEPTDAGTWTIVTGTGAPVIANDLNGYVVASDLATHALTEKITTLADSDEISGTSAIDGYANVRFTLTNLWAWIKSLADGIYVPSSGTKTIGGATTCSGQVQLTVQSLTDGNSALNRDLADGRFPKIISSGLTTSHVLINNSSTLQQIATITVPPGKWKIEAHAAVRVTTMAAGHKLLIGSTATQLNPVLRGGVLRFSGGGSSNTHMVIDEDTGNNPLSMSSGAANTFGTWYAYLIVDLTVETTIPLQMAQVVATAENLKIYRGAYINATKV